MARDQRSPHGWTPGTDPLVCCITADPSLGEECARIAAVAGSRFEAVPTADAAGALWARADAVLLGADVAEVPPQPRQRAVLVGRGVDRALLWQRATALGIDHVAELPDAAGWLVEFLGRGRGGGAGGVVIGVVGGRGGAGASTTAALVAGASALDGRDTLLVDGDRLAGGLEAAISEQPPEGLHWPDLAQASGTINPERLAASLPRSRGVAVLSWPVGGERAQPVSQGAVVGALEAARSAFDVTVVDVGRGRESIEDFAWATDRLLVLVPGTLAGALASAQLLHELPPVPVGALVRGRTAEGLDAEGIASGLKCPFVSVVPHLRGAPAAAEAGTLLELARLRPVRHLTQRILADTDHASEDEALVAVGRRLAGRSGSVA